MPPLAAIERFFERLFERPSARLFRARLQPVQLQRRIERAMESERLAGADRTLVPNRFVVHLHPDDLAGFGDMTGIARHASSPTGRCSSPGRATTRSSIARASTSSATRPSSAPTSGSSPASPTRSPARPAMRAADGRRRRRQRADRVAARPTRWSSRCPDRRPRGPAARDAARTAPARTVDVDGTDLTIGRAADNDLVLADGRVSRHHGRLTGRRGTLVYTDLGSTNGSRVNGVAVGELVLGDGRPDRARRHRHRRRGRPGTAT